MRKQRIKNCILTCIAGSILAGCSNHRDVSFENIANVEQNGQSSLDTFEASVDIQEILGVHQGDLWEDTIETNIEESAKIYANVELPTEPIMNVYESKKQSLSEEYKRELLTTLSADGNIYTSEEGLIPKQELEYFVQQSDLEIDTFDAEMLRTFGHDENDIETLYAKILEENQSIHATYEAAPDEWSKTTNYSINKYAVPYDNQMLRVEFQESPSHSVISAYQQYWKQEQQAGDPKYWTYFNCGGVLSHEGYEDVIRKAEQISHELSGSNFSALNLRMASFSCNNNTENPEYEHGYVVELYRSLPGSYANGFDSDDLYLQSVTYANGELQFENDCLYGYEQITIILNGELNLYSFEYKNPLVQPSVITENVTLLSFDKIQELYRMELANNLPIDHSSYTKDPSGNITYLNHFKSFHKLSLCYLRVSDPVKQDDYEFIPAWILQAATAEAGNSQGTPCVIAINAIDGSVINLNDELFPYKHQ